MPEINTDQIKKWAPLGAAGVLGLAAAGLGWAAVSPGEQRQQAARPEVELARIVVAARELTAGTALVADDLTYLKVEAKNVPAGTFAKIADLLAVPTDDEELDEADDAGRVLTSDVAAGQPLMPRHLAAPETPAGVSAMLPMGYRAISVEVEGDTGLTGLLRPGSHVDVVATLTDGDDTVVRTIAQNVYVLAVGGKVVGVKEPEDDKPGQQEHRDPSVTLVVTPEQAGRLDLAFASGRPRLVLRGGGDRELSRFSGLTFADLLGVSHQDDGFGYAGAEAFGQTPDYPSFEPTVIRDGTTTVVENPSAAGEAGLDVGDISSPTQTKPAARPPRNERPAAEPRPPQRRYVEIIRGGTSTREPLPVPGQPTPPAKDADPFD